MGKDKWKGGYLPPKTTKIGSGISDLGDMSPEDFTADLERCMTDIENDRDAAVKAAKGEDEDDE